MRAYVFIETKMGRASKVAADLAQLKSPSFRLLSIDTVTGAHDIIAVIEAQDADAIGRAISGDLHELADVEKTLSCLVLGS